MRLHAEELQYAKQEEKKFLMDRLEELVKEGRVVRRDKGVAAGHGAEARPKGFLDGVKVEVRNKKEIPIFQYVKGVTPVPRKSYGSVYELGTRVSLGRSRWMSEDVSIFSVADGKRMANTQPKALNHYDSIRMSKIRKAALETPTVLGGLRVLPEMTPGRALMWGSILAVWGTGALMLSGAKYLDIKETSEAPEKLKRALKPIGSWLEGLFLPWRDSLVATGISGAQTSADGPFSRLIVQLKSQLRPHN